MNLTKVVDDCYRKNIRLYVFQHTQKKMKIKAYTNYVDGKTQYY